MLQINYLYTYRLKLSRNIAIKSSNKYSIEHTHLEHFKINKQRKNNQIALIFIIKKTTNIKKSLTLIKKIYRKHKIII